MLATAKHFARWFGPQCDTRTVDWWILWPWLSKNGGTESSPSVCILWLSAAWLCFGGAGEELEQLMKRVWDLPGYSPCSRKLPCGWPLDEGNCLVPRSQKRGAAHSRRDCAKEWQRRPRKWRRMDLIFFDFVEDVEHEQSRSAPWVPCNTYQAWLCSKQNLRLLFFPQHIFWTSCLRFLPHERAELLQVRSPVPIAWSSCLQFQVSLGDVWNGLKAASTKTGGWFRKEGLYHQFTGDSNICEDYNSYPVEECWSFSEHVIWSMATCHAPQVGKAGRLWLRRGWRWSAISRWSADSRDHAS